MIVGAVFLVAGIVGFIMTRDWWWLTLSLIGAIAVASPFLRAIDRALARGNPNARIGEVCEMAFFEEGLRFAGRGHRPHSLGRRPRGSRG
jgi:hypothetical protein